jgi:hypothetical protein
VAGQGIPARRRAASALALCIGLTCAGLGAGAAVAADSHPIDGAIADENNGNANDDGRIIEVGFVEDGSMVAQSAPPMPESVSVAQAAPPVPASPGPEAAVLSFSPARQARPAASLPATGPAGSADPALALLASVLVALGSGLVWAGRQRSSSAT